MLWQNGMRPSAWASRTSPNGAARKGVSKVSHLGSKQEIWSTSLFPSLLNVSEFPPYFLFLYFLSCLFLLLWEIIPFRIEWRAHNVKKLKTSIRELLRIRSDGNMLSFMSICDLFVLPRFVLQVVIPWDARWGFLRRLDCAYVYPPHICMRYLTSPLGEISFFLSWLASTHGKVIKHKPS